MITGTQANEIRAMVVELVERANRILATNDGRDSLDKWNDANTPIKTVQKMLDIFGVNYRIEATPNSYEIIFR